MCRTFGSLGFPRDGLLDLGLLEQGVQCVPARVLVEFVDLLNSDPLPGVGAFPTVDFSIFCLSRGFCIQLSIASASSETSEI